MIGADFSLSFSEKYLNRKYTSYCCGCLSKSEQINKQNNKMLFLLKIYQLVSFSENFRNFRLSSNFYCQQEWHI